MRASKRPRVGALGLAIPLLCGALLGCSGGDEPLPPGERFARRFPREEADWRGESEIPSSPQKSPDSVIWEVSRFDPDTPPTPDQQWAADDFAERCFEAAERNRWFEYERGRADGYGSMVSDRRHFRNMEYVLDDRILDPERPEFLMYEPVPGGGRVLTGFMFLPQKPDERGPQLGGPLTVWHYHVWTRKKCFQHGLINLGYAQRGGCPEGSPSHRSPEMLHVWLIDHLQGRFATTMILPWKMIAEGLQKRKRERGF